MYIDPKGNWYRLALYGTFFEDYKVKRNLCPFMRKVFIGLILTLLVYPIIAATVLLILAAPFYQALTALYYGDWMYWFITSDPFFTLGLIVYFSILFMFIIFLVVSLFTSTSWKQVVRVITNKTVNGITYSAEKAGLSPLVAWIKAVHDKVCIPLDFNKGDYHN